MNNIDTNRVRIPQFIQHLSDFPLLFGLPVYQNT